RENETDGSDKLANTGLRDALAIVRAEIIAPQSAEDHHASLWPFNQPGENEPERRNDIDQRTKARFQSIHIVNIAQADEPEPSQHQNADTGAEIAAVNGHG